MSDSTPAAEFTPPPGMLPPTAPPGRSWGRMLLDEAPYLIMLLAGFAGVVFTSSSGTPNLLYWQILAPVFALLCIAAGWNAAAGRGQRLRLVWTQAAHWAAFLVAMLMTFLPSVRGVVNDNADEISLLLLLGLGTFVAGVHAGSWRIIAVGAVLGISVPAVAMLQQSALLMVVGTMVVAVIGAAFLFARAKR